MARVRLTGLSAEAVGLLRVEVDRQGGGGARNPIDAGAAGEDLVVRRDREAAWQAVAGCTSPLYLVASAVAHAMSRHPYIT